MRIALAGLTELERAISRAQRDLDQATDMLELHTAATTSKGECRWQQSDWRKRAELVAGVDRLTRRVAGLESLLATATVEDTHPGTPSPVGLGTRFPVTTARWQSVCPLSGKLIRPNDLITNYGGAWVRYDEAVADDDRNRRAGIQRRPEQASDVRATTLVDRLPDAA